LTCVSFLPANASKCFKVSYVTQDGFIVMSFDKHPIKIFSPDKFLVKQIPIFKPNSEALLSPSHMHSIESPEKNSFEVILSGKKLLCTLYIKFAEKLCRFEDGEDESKHLSIECRFVNHQRKGVKARSFSAGIILDSRRSIIGDFEGSLYMLDKETKDITKVNKVHLDAVHHLQKLHEVNPSQSTLSP
jgi:hypothetical protein